MHKWEILVLVESLEQPHFGEFCITWFFLRTKMCLSCRIGVPILLHWQWFHVLKKLLCYVAWKFHNRIIVDCRSHETGQYIVKIQSRDQSPTISICVGFTVPCTMQDRRNWGGGTVGSRGTGGGTYIGRSFNPIPTRADYAHLITIHPYRFSDFPTALPCESNVSLS